ncbi:hypothetical protein BD779DRAFT_1671369 [Infundibulicybe gibba]|nr:hypothetical protein BD779DRAFT_1671369 [Infundibulicybe gibba]
MDNLQLNDYDVTSLHIPYGPGWDARRIDKLVYQTDLGMNLLPHPIDDDEKKLQSEEDECIFGGEFRRLNIRDPGRQSMSGSFNPIDSQQAGHVNQMITAGVDVNLDIAVLLIDAGARITARLVNGVTPLHLAARMGQVSVVRKLLQRSAVNAEKMKKDEAEASGDDVPMTTSESERPSSEDDWSSDDHDDAKMNVDTGPEGKSGDGNDDKNMDEDGNQEAHQDKAEEDSDQEDGGEDDDDGNGSESDGSDKDNNKASPTQGGAGGELPEDEEELPDIIEIDQAEWDYGFTALCLAVVYGTVPVIEELLTAGADPKFATKPQSYSDPTFHPLSLTILRDDQHAASEIADDLLTIFHRTVISGKTTLASNILKSDPNSKVVLNFPQYRWGDIIFPIVSAVAMSSYSMLAVLLAHGAKLEFEEDDLLYSQTISDQMKYGNTMTMKEISRPLESAIAAHDYCVELLVAQGANCNVAPKYANGERTDPQERRSLLDWVTMAISTISGKLVVDTHNAPPEEATGWNGYISHHNYRLAQVSQTDRKREREQERRDLNKLNEYFCDIQHILLSKGAKTWNELYPGAPSTAQPRMEEIEDVSSTLLPFGTLIWARFTITPLPKAKILDMGTDKKSETTPLRISVYIPNPTDRGRKQVNISVATIGLTIDIPSQGYTPFFAAVAAGKWDTARLILAIAKAQYKPKKAEEEKFNAKNVKIDDDDDDNDSEDEDGDDDSVASDETIGQDVYVDIAQRPSDINHNDANRVYLGLSVHGKKRKDLAKKNDPNASQDDETAPHPILWIACLRKAKGIIEYLAGNRPLEAYGYFCARNHNERAAKIRRTPNLTEVLPIWLGWTVSPLGESPLTSAILGRDLDTVKLLFKKSPKVLKAALKESIKFLGLNPLMLAVALGCDPSMIDFLLDKSISPAEMDKNNGWNIYHMVCAARQTAVCEHLLRKLPRDVSEALLGHQSKGPMNTPLHLAVKSGAMAVVKVLVEFSKATLNTRDIRGSTPLHSATEHGFVEITKILIGAGGRIIWQENGVGDIPLEITSRNKLASAISSYFHGQAYTKELYSAALRKSLNHLIWTRCVGRSKLFSTIKELVRDGHLQEDSDLFKTLTAFAASMQTRLEKAIEAAEASDTATEDRNRSDECDHDQVHEAILQAISTTPSHREIVHLIDVQRSVHSDLEKHKAENLERLQSRDHDAFVDEEVEEEKGKGTLVSAHLESRLDIY